MQLAAFAVVAASVLGLAATALQGEDPGGEGFDAMLSRIDSVWREHVTRTSSILP